MPVGLLVTVPEPVPALLTVSVNCWRLKVAVQVLSASIVTCPSLQSESPLQPAKTELAFGVDAKVTTVLGLKAAEQVVPQLIPGGVLMTVPSPVPVLLTDKVLIDVLIMSVPMDAAALGFRPAL